jgi:CheY-like chemotaxis protein
MIMLVEDDLMFSVPIVEMARQGGQTVVVANSLEVAYTHLKALDLVGILMDMRLAAADFIAAIPAQVAVAAFGPHVQGAAFLELRRLGVKEVWPNSKLTDRLPRWLQGLTPTL